MKFIKSSFEILDQIPSIDGIYRQIELTGRVLYKSEDKITEDSAKKFVDMLIKRGHTSVLEQGTIYLKLDDNIYKNTFNQDNEKWNAFINKYKTNPYSIVTNNYYDVYITSNYRVLYQNNWLYDLQYLCEPTEYHEKRISVRFILPRSISHEFVRHRQFSFMQESSRYCCYSSDKFNNELTFIIPYWADLKEARYQYWDNDWVDATDKNRIPNTVLKHFEGDSTDIFLSQCESAEVNYKALVNRGCKAQQAREILPLCTKTELVMTGTVEQWKGFFKLHCDSAAHPQARELAIPLKEEFIKRGLLHDN